MAGTADRVKLEQPVFKALLRLLQGDLPRLGLQKPDHRLFESHPLLNDRLVHHLRHGDVVVKADLGRLMEPGTVTETVAGQLDRPRLEANLPSSDGWLVKAAMLSPGLVRRARPVLERAARPALKRYQRRYEI